MALEYLAIVEEEKLLENVLRVGGYLQEQLKSLAPRHAAVQEVRGRGLIQGLQLAIPARPIVEQALAEGVLFNSTQDTVLRFLPPFLLAGKACGQRHASAQEIIAEEARGVTSGRPPFLQFFKF